MGYTLLTFDCFHQGEISRLATSYANESLFMIESRE